MTVAGARMSVWRQNDDGIEEIRVPLLRGRTFDAARPLIAGQGAPPGRLQLRRVRRNGHVVRHRRAVAVLTLVVAAWTVVWAVVTPMFRSPDVPPAPPETSSPSTMMRSW